MRTDCPHVVGLGGCSMCREQEAMTEPKRDEAMELARLILQRFGLTESGTTEPFSDDLALAASLIRPVLEGKDGRIERLETALKQQRNWVMAIMPHPTALAAIDKALEQSK